MIFGEAGDPVPVRVVCSFLQKDRMGAPAGYMLVGNMALALLLASLSDYVHVPSQSHGLQVEQPTFPV